MKVIATFQLLVINLLCFVAADTAIVNVGRNWDCFKMVDFSILISKRNLTMTNDSINRPPYHLTSSKLKLYKQQISSGNPAFFAESRNHLIVYEVDSSVLDDFQFRVSYAAPSVARIEAVCVMEKSRKIIVLFADWIATSHLSLKQLPSIIQYNVVWERLYFSVLPETSLSFVISLVVLTTVASCVVFPVLLHRIKQVPELEPLKTE